MEYRYLKVNKILELFECFKYYLKNTVINIVTFYNGTVFL